MHSDPTKYHRPIEPTQFAYSNPYETLNPYYGEIPPAPPPPPKQHHIGIRVALASILCLVVILGAVFFGITHSSAQQKVTQVTPTPKPTPTIAPTATPTQVPTATPTPTPVPTSPPIVSYYASDIYNDFVANGLGGLHPKNDTNWSCCTYNPAGGAVAWVDSASGYVLDIATFLNVHNAEVDENDLFRQGYYANVVHACLLSYDKTVPMSVIGKYVQLMQTYCN